MQDFLKKFLEYAVGLVFMLAVFWVGSALTKPHDGAFEKIAAANPEYENPDRYFQILVEDFHGGSLENKRYYDLCDQYGDSWKMIGECVAAYNLCLSNPPNGEMPVMCLEEKIPYNWRMNLHGRKKHASYLAEALATENPISK